ncbi:hypothetical protein KR059_006998, partial [Drosophila kikkawai]
VFEMKCSRNITDLPIEILDILFECCGNMTNKLHLAQAHPYLAQAFAYHCRNLFKHIPVYEKKSLCYWRLTLPGCGPNIKKIDRVIRENDHDAVELVNLIALHCSKLEKIKLIFETDSVNCVKSLICQRQNSLRAINLRLKLKLKSPEMNTKMLHELPELPLLEELKIFNIPIENFYHIQKFENLVKLAIRYKNSKPVVIDILALCAPLKKLQILALKGVGIIASEETKIHLPVIQLKKLNIACEEHNSHAEVQRFILSQGKSLESLSHDCPREPYRHEDFLEIIRICRNLRFFELPSGGVVFDLEFVEEIVDILRHNGFTPDNPLVIMARDRPRYTKLVKWV